MEKGILCFLLIVLSICVSGKKKNSVIEGAWKLVQSQEVIDGKAKTDFPGNSKIDQVKIWSGNQVMFVGRILSKNRSSDAYGVGTFKLDGSRYEENPGIISYKQLEGKTIKMKLELKNDTLIQTFPVDDSGRLENNSGDIEKYVRLR